MLVKWFGSQKNMLRVLAWGFTFTLVFAICQDSAWAQGSHGTVEAPAPEGEFWRDLAANIFNSKGLMRVLSRPEYTVLAFLALNLIVFTETGLLIGFFLPGDSLLVITGLICANPDCKWPLPLLLLTLSMSAIVGDTVGYWIGFKAGPRIFNREKSFFFHKDHLLKAQQFYETYGAKTIVLARFMPFLRTFAPVVAGVGKMEYKKFLFYNIVGGVGWVFSMILAGRFLPEVLDPLLQTVFGDSFHVAEHVEKVVIVVVLLSIAPGIYAWVKAKLASKKTNETPGKEIEPALLGK